MLLPYSPDFGLVRIRKALDPSWVNPYQVLDERYLSSGSTFSVRQCTDALFQSHVDLDTEGDVDLIVHFSDNHSDDSGPEIVIFMERTEKIGDIPSRVLEQLHMPPRSPIHYATFCERDGKMIEIPAPRLISEMGWASGQPVSVHPVASHLKVNVHFRSVENPRYKVRLSRDATREGLIDAFKQLYPDFPPSETYYVALVKHSRGIVRIPADSYLIELPLSRRGAVMIVDIKPIHRDFVKLSVAKAQREFDKVTLLCNSEMTMAEVAELFFFGGELGSRMAFEVWRVQGGEKVPVSIKESVSSMDLEDGQVLIVNAAPRSQAQSLRSPRKSSG
jgi:hypothetical protein